MFIIALLFGKPLLILNKGSQLAAQTSDLVGRHIFHRLAPEFGFSLRMFYKNLMISLLTSKIDKISHSPRFLTSQKFSRSDNTMDSPFPI